MSRNIVLWIVSMLYIVAIVYSCLSKRYTNNVTFGVNNPSECIRTVPMLGAIRGVEIDMTNGSETYCKKEK